MRLTNRNSVLYLHGLSLSSKPHSVINTEGKCIIISFFSKSVACALGFVQYVMCDTLKPYVVTLKPFIGDTISHDPL